MARLPPLSALRAFECAARHRSFTKAAAELHVTQSAVSRHMRTLEEWLDVPLFYRNHKAIALTPEGEIYMRELVAAFGHIDLATRRVQRSGRQDVLHIHTYATIAMRWLIPRLRRFQEDNPEIDVQLTASTRPVDFEHDEVHGAIRTGPPSWAENVRMDTLFNTTIVPVCAPTLAHEPWPLRAPTDLVHATLLHSLARPDDWLTWLRSAGAGEAVNAARGLKFESSIMVYLAAQRGLGVAIAQKFLVEEDLAAGVLVQPFPLEVKSERTYYFLSSPRYEGSAALELFRAWLLAELPKSPQQAGATPVRLPAHKKRRPTRSLRLKVS